MAIVPKILQYQNTVTISNGECIRRSNELFYRDKFLHPLEWQTLLNAISGNVICTINSFGNGVCNGDSGGPLVADGTLIGVVSSSIGCAMGYPDIYTNLYEYRDWIMEVMQKKNLQ